MAEHGALAPVGGGEEAAVGVGGGGAILGNALCFHGDGQEEGSNEAVRYRGNETEAGVELAARGR